MTTPTKLSCARQWSFEDTVLVLKRSFGRGPFPPDALGFGSRWSYDAPPELDPFGREIDEDQYALAQPGAVGPGDEVHSRRVPALGRGDTTMSSPLCGRGDLDRLRYPEAAEDPGVIESRGAADLTPLHWAVRGQSPECARWLLDRGADVNAESLTGRRVPGTCDVSRPKSLLREQPRSSTWSGSPSGDSPWSGRRVRRRPDHPQDRKGRTPLHRATYLGEVEAAEALMRVLGGRHAAPDPHRQDGDRAGAPSAASTLKPKA